jgi:hypothetical protein
MKTKYLSLALLLCIVSSQHRAFGAKGTPQTPPAAQQKSGLWSWFRGGPKTPKVISAKDQEALNKQLWDLTKKGDVVAIKAVWDYIQKQKPQIPKIGTEPVSIVTQLPYSAYISTNSIDSAEQVLVDLRNKNTWLKNQQKAAPDNEKAYADQITFFDTDCTAIEKIVTDNKKEHASYVTKLSNKITELLNQKADPTVLFEHDITGKKISSLGNALRNNELAILEVLLGKDNKGINNPGAIDGKSLLAYACDPETKNLKAAKILVERTQQNAAREEHKRRKSEEALKIA